MLFNDEGYDSIQFSAVVPLKNAIFVKTQVSVPPVALIAARGLVEAARLGTARTVRETKRKVGKWKVLFPVKCKGPE